MGSTFGCATVAGSFAMGYSRTRFYSSGNTYCRLSRIIPVHMLQTYAAGAAAAEQLAERVRGRKAE